MSQQNIIRAWKDAEYRNSLSATERAAFVVIAVMLSALANTGVTAGQSAAELGATTNNSAFSITISTETAPQDLLQVTSSDGTPERDCFESCQFAYLAGSTLTLRVPFPTDQVNCIRFAGWTGACAGQGATCTVVLNGDLVTEAVWAIIRHCSPR
jgi:hypothetical protein